MFLVIRIRGELGTVKRVKTTFKSLNLKRNNTCMVFPENKEITGMLKSINNYVAYGKIKKDDLGLLLEERGMVGKKRISESLNKLEYKKIDDLVDDIWNNKVKLGELRKKGLNLPFRLSSPSKGFKGAKKGYNQKGDLGFQGDKIIDVLKKMI